MLKYFFMVSVFVISYFSMSYSQVPILDEYGNETGLYNVNPDLDGEVWISGGGIPLTELEEKCIPELSLPPHYKDRTTYPLPEKVDNSRNKYFPPIFTQKGASCCQAVSVAYVFSYEMSRERDVDGKTKENIYPYGFSYNFINKGKTGTYSGYTSGWTATKELGMPNIVDFGGSLQGSASQTSWMNGYDKYYRAMNNKYVKSFSMNSASQEGVEKMKQWLYDHADGSKVGGVIAFLAWGGQTKKNLPSSSPEAGHAYIQKFGTSGGHCMTIVGYHDNILYDYNEDGRIDNGEKGGFLMVNSYGTNFGTKGRAYIPYKLFLDGKLKMKNVHGITVQKSFKTNLAYKVTITHNQRDKLKIIRGFAEDVNATSPTKTYTYRTSFSNGGSLPMEGKGLSETIELGLNVTEFVKEISGKKAKLFLEIESKGGSGKVNSFSVMDYTGETVKEFKCTEKDVTIANGKTTLSVVYDAVNISKNNSADLHKDQLFYASPLKSGNNIVFKIQTPINEKATIQVLTIHGKLIYQKSFQTAKNQEFHWNVKSNSNLTVANGKYIAKLSYLDANRREKNLYTSVFIME